MKVSYTEMNRDRDKRVKRKERWHMIRGGPYL